MLGRNGSLILSAAVLSEPPQRGVGVQARIFSLAAVYYCCETRQPPWGVKGAVDGTFSSIFMIGKHPYAAFWSTQFVPASPMQWITGLGLPETEVGETPQQETHNVHVLSLALALRLTC